MAYTGSLFKKSKLWRNSQKALCNGWDRVSLGKKTTADVSVKPAEEGLLEGHRCQGEPALTLVTANRSLGFLLILHLIHQSCIYMHKILHLNAPILPSIHPWLRLCFPYSLSKSVRKVTQFSPSLSSCLCSGHLILLRGEMRLLCLCQGLSVFHTWSTVRNRGCCTPAIQHWPEQIYTAQCSPTPVHLFWECFREGKGWKCSRRRRSNTKWGKTIL